MARLFTKYKMKIFELLTEAKARIEHPEDMILDGGSVGAIAALESLKDAATSSKNVSLKWDGTPAIIAGCVNGRFVMTDKVGLKKQQLPASPKKMYSMIFDRKPNQIGRGDYSNQVATLFPIIQKMIPKNFPGLVQFDVMWFRRPSIVGGAFEFKPNKVQYRIPVNSNLGKKISQSQYGVVVHSYFETPMDEEPRGIQDFNSLGLKPVQELVILNPKATFEVHPNKNLLAAIAKLGEFTKSAAKSIDDFFDQNRLAEKQISDLPQLMKTFQASLARNGKTPSSNMQNMFLTWLKKSALKEPKKATIMEYINSHRVGYLSIWFIAKSVAAIKMKILKSYTEQLEDIQASINGIPSHEGYVVDAPSGKIKLVNRPLFMGNKTVGAFSPTSSSSISTL